MIYKTEFRIGEEVYVQEGKKIFKAKVNSILISPKHEGIPEIKYGLVSENPEFYDVNPFKEDRLLEKEEAKVKFENLTLDAFVELFGE